MVSQPSWFITSHKDGWIMMVDFWVDLRVVSGELMDKMEFMLRDHGMRWSNMGFS